MNDFTFTKKASEQDTVSVDQEVALNRINCYSDAMIVYTQACQSHVPACRVYAKTDKLFDGIPPYNPETLKKLNQKHVVNIDFGDARSREQKAVKSYYNIFYSNKFLAEINFYDTEELRGLFPNAPEVVSDELLKDWSNIATEEWTKLMRVGWGKQFFTKMSFHLKENMRYGRNILYWENPAEWVFKVGTIYSHYLTDDAMVDCDLNDKHIVKHQMYMSELLEKYFKDNTGYWNKDALASLIVLKLQESQYYADDEKFQGLDTPAIIEKVVRDLREHKSELYNFNNIVVDVATLFIKEFETDTQLGGISHLIFAPEYPDSQVLFFKDRAYKEMSDVILISHLLPGIERAKDAKGLGQIAYGHLSEINKQKCGLATSLKIEGTVFFKGATDSVSDLKRITFPIGGGSAAVLPNNLELSVQRAGAVNQNTLAGIEYLANDIDKNSLFLVSSPLAPNTPVSTQRQRFREAVELQETNIAHYFATTLDPLYKTIFKKQLDNQSKSNYGGKLFRSFIKNCERRGIPQEIWQNTTETRDEFTGIPSYLAIAAYKATGTGSQVADYQRIEDGYAVGIPQKLGPRGKRYWDELEISAIFGQGMVEKLKPAADVQNDPTFQHMLSDMVANDLEAGKAVRWSPDLDQAIFAETLIKRMGEVNQKYEENKGINPEARTPEERELLYATDTALQGLGNFAGLALTLVAEDPRNAELFAALQPAFLQLEGIAQGINANANKAREAEAQEFAQLNAQNNIEMQKIALEHQRKVLDARNKHLVEIFKVDGSFKLDIIKARQKEYLDRLKLNNETMTNIIKARKSEASSTQK